MLHPRWHGRPAPKRAKPRGYTGLLNGNNLVHGGNVECVPVYAGNAINNSWFRSRAGSAPFFGLTASQIVLHFEYRARNRVGVVLQVRRQVSGLDEFGD